MLRILRIALQVVLVFLLVSIVIGIASGGTGAVEKVVLVGIAVPLIWAGSAVRRLGRPTSAPG